MPKQPTLVERVSKHDREIAAIRTLVRTGMKMLVQIEQAQKRTEANLQRLEQTLDRFIRSLERGGGNGHTKGRGIH